MVQKTPSSINDSVNRSSLLLSNQKEFVNFAEKQNEKDTRNSEKPLTALESFERKTTSQKKELRVSIEYHRRQQPKISEAKKPLK